MSRRAAVRDLDLDRVADACVIAQGVARAATVGWGLKTRQGWMIAVGAAGRVDSGQGRPVTPATPFDLASVTKPFIALTAARLVARGALRWEDPLGDLLPGARETRSSGCPLEYLLTHRSGLVAHLPLFDVLRARRAVIMARVLTRVANARRPECEGPMPAGGFASLYSDLGYLLAGLALEAATHRSLDALVAEEVTDSLGLQAGSMRQWLALDRGISEVVPTEVVSWRGGSLQGVVHDENAWTTGGHGLAGHAGLFGTVEAVLRFGAALLDALRAGSEWLDAKSMAHVLRPREGSSLRLGFDTKSPEHSRAGVRAAPSSFGHLGFTGTSFWCDPEHQVVTALLTNRVRPTRQNSRIRAARPRTHDALFDHALTGRAT